MKASPLIIFLMLGLLGCSSDQPNKQTTLEASGDYWTAIVNDTVVEENGKSYFHIRFIYMGEKSDLKDIDRITFAQGTTLGTQLVNVYDPSYKEQLILNGDYEEANEERYGIKVENIKDRSSNEFTIEYYMLESDNGSTVFDAMEEDRMNIQIQWESSGNNYKEELNIGVNG